MNIATIILVSACLAIPDESVVAFDSLFDVSGYPKVGDVPTLNRKIFKGVRVAIREHPYVVSIRRQYSHYLTGVLITSSLVLTVAHPLYLVPIQELGVVSGENYADRGTLLRTVILLVVHDDFDPYTLRNDIAMIKFYEDAYLRTSMKIIKLFSILGESLNGTKGFVTGWGRCDMTGKELCLPRGSIYYPDEKLDPMLRTIVLDLILPNYFCNGYKRQDIILQPGMLCVGEAREDNPVAPCMAVPGAPLVVHGHLAGLMSWGFGCGYSHDLPLVYTSTQYYNEWIYHTIDILNMLMPENYTELFEATRAYISCEWLTETRLVKPNGHDDVAKELEETNIDKVLSNLRGDYYDIRDFVDEGRYRESKLKIINNIRSRVETLALLNETKDKLRKGVPFIPNYLLVDDSDYEKDEDSY